jgi:hypothetical protein
MLAGLCGQLSDTVGSVCAGGQPSVPFSPPSSERKTRAGEYAGLHRQQSQQTDSFSSSTHAADVCKSTYAVCCCSPPVLTGTFWTHLLLHMQPVHHQTAAQKATHFTTSAHSSVSAPCNELLTCTPATQTPARFPNLSTTPSLSLCLLLIIRPPHITAPVQHPQQHPG